MVNNKKIPASLKKIIIGKPQEEPEVILPLVEEDNDIVEDSLFTEDEAYTDDQQEDGTEEFEDEDDLFYDPSLFQPVKSVGRASVSSGAGAVSVVKTPGNGNRLSISSQIMEALGDPEEVQVQIHDDAIAIAVEFPNPSFSYPVKRIGKKGVIYSASLIREIAEELSLDFTGRTTVTLYRYKVINDVENVVVVVKK